MPKASKKRKTKAAEFAKAKLKLGKGKRQASNAVDTSFKARSIVLPTQTIALEREQSTLTTKRKQTLDDLVSHLKHFGSGPRRDAILGLKELLDTYPALIRPSLTTLVNACVRLIVDEEQIVRRTLHSFFSWLLPRVPKEEVLPHASLLVLFTTSAQTHIFPEIRIDAVRFLNLWLEHIPHALVDGWSSGGNNHGSRVLDGYLGILTTGTRFREGDSSITAASTASVVLSPASKLLVLKSLSRFLQSALSLTNNQRSNALDCLETEPRVTWYLASSFVSHEALEVFDRLLRPTWTSKSPPVLRCWSTDVDDESEREYTVGRYELATEACGVPWSLQQLGDVTTLSERLTDMSASSMDTASFVAKLAHALHSTIVSTILDCLPTVFAPARSPSDHELQMLIAVAEITRTMYSAILRGSASKSNDQACEDLSLILNYMTPYFPFTPNANSSLSGVDVKLETAFQGLNILYCHLVSLLALSRPAGQSQNTRKGNRSRANQESKSTLDKQTELVSDYVVRVLRGEAVTSQLGRGLATHTYTALLPTVWSLLNTDHPHYSSAVFQAVLDHAMRTSSTAAVKAPTIDFVARLALLDTEPAYKGRFKIAKTMDGAEKLKEWISHSAKTLWEVGSNNPPLTETTLRFLLRFFQRQGQGSLIHRDPQLIERVQAQLVPFFGVAHPVRGASPGPYTTLAAPALRRLALDIVTTLVSARVLLPELDASVQMAVAGTEEQAYWSHVREARA